MKQHVSDAWSALRDRVASDGDTTNRESRWYGDTANLSPTERAYLVNCFFHRADESIATLVGEYGGFAIYRPVRIEGESVPVDNRALQMLPWPVFLDEFGATGPDVEDTPDDLEERVENAPDRPHVVSRTLRLDLGDEEGTMTFRDVYSNDLISTGTYEADGIDAWMDYYAEGNRDILTTRSIILFEGDLHGFAAYKHHNIDGEIPRDGYLSLAPWDEFIDRYGHPNDAPETRPL